MVAPVSSGVVRLGDVAGRIERLEVRCARCPRRGLLRLSRLIAEHGPNLNFPALGNLLAASCPNAHETYGQRCFVIWPDLPRLAREGRQPPG